MRRLADRFARRSSRCPSLDSLRQLLDQAARDLGFDYFALVHHASLGAPEAGFARIHNYPADWVSQLETRGAAGVDPVHSACYRSSAGFAWADIGDIACLDPHQHAILADSRDYGLGDGFTVPVNVPGEPAGSCSFAVRPGARLPRQRLMCAELVGRRAFDAARRLTGDIARPRRPHLSPRELDCLRLIAAGKTDWEISVILGIGVETARQYVKRARSAYNVVSRTQLVVLGLRDSWLGFEDAAPYRDKS